MHTCFCLYLPFFGSVVLELYALTSFRHFPHACHVQCENHGRQFYRCGISGGDQCKTYIWLNETAGQYSGGGGSGGRSDSCDGDRGENQDRPMCEGHEEPCAFRTVRKEVIVTAL